MAVKLIKASKPNELKRVAAYARVSTLNEEQADSYNTQVAYYSKLIETKSNWQFVKVYADKGISGSRAKLRPGFIEMIEDAEKGKIDLILVKSISRFARNAADAQAYVHLLKGYGVEVRFDNENLSTFDPSSEMILNVLASIAQEEIHSLSDRVKWAYEKKLDRGERRIGNNHVLGYDEIDGKLTPNNDAWIVKEIFRCYIDGMSTSEISKRLKAKGAKTLRGKDTFSPGLIHNMLSTVIYVGDRHLQQTPPRNYLTHKPDPTKPYKSKYISNDHEAIIERDDWDKVQKLLNERKERKKAGIYDTCHASPLYGRVVCGECGTPYTRRTIRKNGKLVKVWKCRERLKGSKGNGCKGRIVPEDEILEFADKTEGKIVVHKEGTITGELKAEKL